MMIATKCQAAHLLIYYHQLHCSIDKDSSRAAFRRLEPTLTAFLHTVLEHRQEEGRTKGGCQVSLLVPLPGASFVVCCYSLFVWSPLSALGLGPPCLCADGPVAFGQAH